MATFAMIQNALQATLPDVSTPLGLRGLGIAPK
jgi:hypothetical protein